MKDPLEGNDVEASALFKLSREWVIMDSTRAVVAKMEKGENKRYFRQLRRLAEK